ncbi:MAG: HEAT repeat domain-containing protein, partial [Acidobacteria bacterium]|nr:HEAT repeat domain-containing protein [Acidobacteriota bacterium]
LFWLGQSDEPRAAGWIREAIAGDRDPEVREQGVFALSQLDDGARELARLLRETDDPALRRQALFWLGQSEDPEALAALAGILGAE